MEGETTPWRTITAAGDTVRTLRSKRLFVDEKVEGSVSDKILLNLRCSTLLFRDGSVLLCQRTRGDKAWVLPGGTPRKGEGTAAAAQREVGEETGLSVHSERVAFVLETTSRDASHHLIEIVFIGAELDGRREPRQLESALRPQFVPLEQLGGLELRPPIAGYIRGHAMRHRSDGSFSDPYTAAYLGNLWRMNEEEDNATGRRKHLKNG